MEGFLRSSFFPLVLLPCVAFLFPFSALAQQASANSGESPAHPVVCAGEDDTEAIQSAFNSAGNIQVSGNCTITHHLVYFSNSTIDLTGATITYNQSKADWLLVNEAGMSTNRTPVGKDAERSFSDARTQNGSWTIFSSTAHFTSEDVGKSINCRAAAGAGADLDLHTRIALINSPISATLDDPAGEDLSSTTCYIFDRDNNVTITGGTLIVTGTLQPATSYPMVKAKTINNVVIQNMSLIEPGTTGMYHLVLQDAYNFNASGIAVQGTQTLQDGIDVIGPAALGNISNISGYSGDDFVAVTTSYVGQLIDSSTFGAVSNITLQNIHGESVQGEGGVALFVRAPGNINNVSISGVTGETAAIPGTNRVGFGIGLKLSYFSQDPGTPGNINALSAEKITGWFRGPAVRFGTPLVNTATLRNVSDSNPKCAPQNDLIMVKSDSIVTNLDISSLSGESTNCAGILGVAPGAIVTFP
jgi:hypothetical protein